MSFGTTLIDAQEIVKKNGYAFDYLKAIFMVDNCLPQWEMTKEQEKAEKKNIPENMDKIAQDIANKVKTTDIPTKGGKLMTNITRRFFSPGDDYSKKYKIDDSCNACGTCSQLCPVGNITVTDKVVFGNYCEGCQACIHLCSRNAIHLRFERSSARWLNPEVKLKEIIKSNNIK